MGSEVFEFYVDQALVFDEVANALSAFFSIPRTSVVSEMWSDENIGTSPRVGLELTDIGGSFRSTVGIVTDFHIEHWRYRPLFASIAAALGTPVLAAEALGQDDLALARDPHLPGWLLYQSDGSIQSVRETTGTDHYEVEIAETL